MKTIYPLIILSYIMLTGCTNIAAYDWLHQNQNNSPRVVNDPKNQLIHNHERIIVSINPHDFNKETIDNVKSIYEQNLKELGYHVITGNSDELPTLVAQINLDRQTETGSEQVQECSDQDMLVPTEKGFVTEKQYVCNTTTHYYTYYSYTNEMMMVKVPSTCNNPTVQNPYCLSQNSEVIYQSYGVHTSRNIMDTFMFIRLMQAIFATYPSNQSYDVYTTTTPMGYKPAILFKPL